MKRPEWSILVSSRNDFLPIVIGAVILMITVPALLMLIFDVEPNSESLARPVGVLLALGMIAGLAFVVMGLRVCSTPGSTVYRITHGRIFER